ncbi:MAG: GNAT family N-acetyltransferase [Pseudomonadota bacterium]
MNERLAFIRSVEVFRPYNNEFPGELLWDQGVDDARLDIWADAAIVRIAKQDEQILGIYAMDREGSAAFHLHGVIVAPPARRRGLGRWLVGHAIGVAESKGGRYLLAPVAGASRMLSRIGFARTADGLRFDLLPE